MKTALISIRLGSTGSHVNYNLVSFLSNHLVASYHLGRSRNGSSGSCGASGGGCGSRHSHRRTRCRRRRQSRRRRSQSRRRRSQSPSSSKVKPRLSGPCMIIRISRLSGLFLWSQFGHEYLLVNDQDP